MDDVTPGRLRAVQDLVNSFDIRRGRDDLAGPREAAGWLRARGLLGSGARLAAADVTRLHDLRAALRRLCLANNGAPVRPADLVALDRVVRESGLRPAFGGEGGARLDVAARGFTGALGRLVAIVHDAMRDGTWRRLKACPEDACNYTFYDHSRNGSRVWCSMAGCGTRAKMRAYRARAAGAGARTGSAGDSGRRAEPGRAGRSART